MVYARATDGRLRIHFPEVKAGQAVICAIAVAKKDNTPALATPPFVKPAMVARQHTGQGFWHALDTDTIAKLPKQELPQDTEARPATVYQPATPAQQVQDALHHHGHPDQRRHLPSRDSHRPGNV